MKVFKKCVILICWFFCLSTCDEDVVIVTTPLGKISGKRISYLGKSLDEFLGIPYAEKMTNNERFKKAKPVGKYNFMIKAHKLSPYCPIDRDDEIEMSEDCLFLNVWNPVDASKNATLKPVMFWISGRDFLSGPRINGNYDGKALSAYGDVIVVSANYRTGSFGFLTIGNPEEPGNLAFHDQNLALRWVHENIGFFGGNPSQVTIFGQGDGSVSISFHILSGKSNGLFKRAILQSGSYYTHNFGHGKRASLQAAIKLAKLVGCETQFQNSYTHMNKTMKCLRNMHWKDLLKAQKSLSFSHFHPILEEEFARIEDIIHFPLHFNDVEIIIGITKEEGNLYLVNNNNFDLFNLNAAEVSKILSTISEEIPENLKHIVGQYFEDDHVEVRQGLANVFSDRYYMCPSLMLADSYASRGGHVRFYNFTHQSEQDFWPDWVGATHNSDMFYTLGRILDPEFEFSKTDIDFSKHLMTLWTNFAKDKELPGWPTYTPYSAIAMELNPHRNTSTIIPRASRCYELWKNVFEEFIASFLREKSLPFVAAVDEDI